MPRRIVFVGHEASRTGAPIFLLHLIRWIREHTDYACELVILSGGELEQEYRSVVPCTVLRAKRHPIPVSALNFFQKVRRAVSIASDRMRAWFLCKMLRRRWKRDGVDLFYLNTVVIGNVLKLFDNIPAHTVLHAHELALGIRWGIGLHGLAKLRSRSDAVIAASEAVKKLFVGTYGFDDATMHVVYEAIAAVPEQKNALKKQALAVRTSLGISPEAIVVGMCGTMDWRKGVDLFVQLAKTVHRTSAGTPLHFLWLGGGDEEEVFKRHFVDEYCLSADDVSRIHFVGAKPDPTPTLAAMDIFALTSREDPFPLVHLEAASLGLPIVCFHGAGGAEEWLGDGVGFVVPFADTDAMAEKVLLLSRDAALRRSMGERAAAIVSERFVIDVIGPQILSFLHSSFPDLRS